MYPYSFGTCFPLPNYLSEGAEEDHETMRIMPIGAGNEVGRSCIILKYMGKTIMLDCGIHPVSPAGTHTSSIVRVAYDLLRHKLDIIRMTEYILW